MMIKSICILASTFILIKTFRDQDAYIFDSIGPTRVIILDLITLFFKTIFIQLDDNKYLYKNNLI